MKYVIQAAKKTFCRECEGSVDFLCPEKLKGAMFYICWDCKKVFQAGVGEVTRDA